MGALLELKIGVRGQRALSRKFGLLASALGDMTNVWRRVVHPFVIKHQKEQFRTSGRHGGRPWAGYEREPKYRGYKQAMVGHLEILRWERGNEQLYPSIVAPSHPDHIFQATAKSARVGTSVPHALTLNKGGVGPFGEPYPAREIYAMKASQKKDLITQVQREILNQIGAGRLRAARIF